MEGNILIASGELRQIVERYEAREGEKQQVMEDQKEILADAKARGYDVKALRKVIALRKMTADQIAEEEAVLDLYRSALGM